MPRISSPDAPGLLIVLSAPSGTGKSTIANRLIERNEDLAFSISWTSRPPREGERNGREYHFVDEETFRSMIDGGRFLEWAKVHGHLYGTEAGETRRVLESGRDLLLDIDVQGAEQVRKQEPTAVSIFLLPPDWKTLESRLAGRGTDTPEAVKRRLAAAREEARRSTSYDYIVMNRDLDDCSSEIECIRLAEKRKGSRMARIASRFLSEGSDGSDGADAMEAAGDQAEPAKKDKP